MQAKLHESTTVDQIVSQSPFEIISTAGSIPTLDRSSSKAKVEQLVSALVADGQSQESALLHALSLGTIAFSRTLLDSINDAIRAHSPGFRQSTLFQVVYVEGEFESAVSLLLELLQSRSGSAANEEQHARSHALLMCSHELLCEISKLLTKCRLQESQEMWPEQQAPALDPLAQVVALNRELLAENSVVGESTETIAKYLNI